MRLPTLRLATFNILHGRNPADDQVDLDTFAAAVAGLDADVLALQEVDRNQPRSHSADLTAVAAEAMGAVDSRFVAAMSGTAGATWVAATGAEQPDAAAYGVALLSRHPVSAWEVVRLPAVRVPVPMRFHGDRLPTWVRDEARVAVAATVDVDGASLTAVSTHLTFLRWWNRRQLKLLVDALGPMPRPVALMGDLNMELDAATAASGLTPAAAHATFPVDDPSEQLDHVLVEGPLRVTASESRRLPLSDHRALVVDVEGEP